MAVSGQDIVDYMKQFIGLQYVWGGATPAGFDCSGLMQYGFKQFGVNIPRVTYDQIGVGEAISAKGLRVGDMVFFDTDGSVGGPDHVGIYAGNGQMLHAPRPGKGIELTDITGGYWMGKFMGGRRVSGVSSPGSSPNDAATTEEAKKLTPEELAATYGWSVAFMESNPELKKLFESAVKETWTGAKFQAEVRNTKWWKTTSESARQAQALESSDPATYQAQMAATKMQVELLANQMGASIPDGKLAEITKNVITMAMDETALRSVLAGYIKFTKEGTLSGEAGMHEFVMRQYAAAQGVKLSDDALKQQAQMVVKKLASTEDFKAQVREQAKSAFPGYTEQIDSGMTMKDLAQPFQNVMSQTLGIPLETVLIDDPIIKSALNGVNQEGKPIGLSLSQFTDVLKNDPRWRKTQQAQQDIMGTANKVLQDMGLMG